MMIRWLANWIEKLDFPLFDEVARRCVALRGYVQPAESDGWSDGGSDIRVFHPSNNTPLRVAIQRSVRKDWKGKVMEDIIKAKDRLHCHTFIYVSSRRIPNAEFQPTVDEALSLHGVAAQKMDNEHIASLLADNDDVGWFLDHVGAQRSLTYVRPPSMRTFVADSFVLFSNDAADFRNRVAEQALRCVLCDVDSLTRQEATAQASEALGTGGAYEQRLCSGAFDRLLQAGSVVPVDGGVCLEPRERSRLRQARELVEAEWTIFCEDVRSILQKYQVPSAETEQGARDVAAQLGKIVVAYRDYQVALLSPSKLDQALRRRIASEANAVFGLLDQQGVSLDRRTQCIEELLQLEDSHPVVSSLTAGEVFRRLSTIEETDLARVVGGRNRIRVILDSSVMIPLLCILLYEHVNDRSEAAVRFLYDRLQDLGHAAAIPYPYLEECATHLIEAGHFGGLVGSVSPRELAYSENAYVAYHSKLHDDRTFGDFLKSLGYLGRGTEFKRHRTAIMAHLETVCRRYNINSFWIDHKQIPAEILKQTEVDLSHLYEKHWKDRPSVLVDHDAKVAAYMRAQQGAREETDLLVSCDNVLLELCAGGEYEWWCLEPQYAGDILAMSAIGQRRSTMGVDLALQLTSADRKSAARVWDTLAHLEQDGFYDAQLLEKAKEFKEEFLNTQRSASPTAKQIVQSWTKWKDRGRS